MPVDNVERAAYIRRAFEECKAAACCGDEMLAPTAVENVGAFWSVLVTDNGDKAGDTVEEVGYDLLNSAPLEAGVSWLHRISKKIWMKNFLSYSISFYQHNILKEKTTEEYRPKNTFLEKQTRQRNLVQGPAVHHPTEVWMIWAGRRAR
ncbi:hypothetical protein ACJJTC_014486 [Scirpophaga incertulas]